MATVPHVHPAAEKAHTFEFEERPLIESSGAREQDSPALAEYSLPGYPSQVGVSEGPRDLPCCSGVPGCPRYLAVRCYLAARDLKHGSLDILEITQPHLRIVWFLC